QGETILEFDGVEARYIVGVEGARAEDKVGDDIESLVNNLHVFTEEFVEERPFIGEIFVEPIHK
ncbi:hypothetical protein C0995_014097, partial [Termitomyces sp. Mi166